MKVTFVDPRESVKKISDIPAGKGFTIYDGNDTVYVMLNEDRYLNTKSLRTLCVAAAPKDACAIECEVELVVSHG